MLKKLNKIKKNLKENNQDGATTVEFLVAFIGIFVLLMIIIQVVLILINGIMVNHALAIASQEASARGGIDQTVDQVYLSKLPSWLRDDCASGGNCISSDVSKKQSIIVPGVSECLSKGQIFDVNATYTQDLFVAKLIGIKKPFVTMRRTAKVASQSLNQNGGDCL